MKVMMMTLALQLSGQSVHIRNLGTGLIARGHEVIVATGHLATGMPLGQEYFEKSGMLVVPIPVANLGAGLLPFMTGSIRDGWSLRQMLKQYQPDVVHLHAVTLAAQVQVARLLLSHAPVVVTTFNNESISPQKKKLGQLACKTFRHALGQRVLAISSEMVDFIPSEIGVDRDLVRLISYSVDNKYYVPPTPQQRSAARHLMSLAEDEVAVCCIARLEPRKNQYRLIRAVAALRRRGLPVRLLLAGEDINSYISELHALVEHERCADGVSFLGFQDPLTVYYASDINALVSLEEGFGLVVVEAAMTGLPSLRSRSSGAKDQVTDGQNGLLVDANSVEAITSELEKMVMDESYRQQLGGTANVEARAKYSLEVMANQVEQIYQELVPTK